ncbi:MAG: methionine--tRNA ligase subunit beta [Candidatus Omnitrophica bacterium]|nr:methionine--tRNA ligase subunit beta [Candidatus Omnitrophota bacterium]
MITYQDFSKLDLRVAKIIEAQIHPDADKLLVLKVDIGEKEVQLVAGIKDFYESDELIGKKIAVLTNLEPRKIRGYESQGMLLAASQGESLSVLTVDKDIAEGSKIS